MSFRKCEIIPKATRKKGWIVSTLSGCLRIAVLSRYILQKPAFLLSHFSSRVISQQFSRSRSVCLLLLSGKVFWEKESFFFLENFSGKILLEGSFGRGLKHYFEPAICFFCQAVKWDFARRLIFHSYTVMHASLHIFTFPRNRIFLISIFHKC